MRLDVEKFAEVLVATIKSATASLATRVSALEQRATERPQDGRDGATGPAGPPGPAGERGADGRDGRDGADGKDGTPGERGEPGVAGERGADGRDGRDGNDGVDGPQGPQGEKGVDGLNGKDGADGLGFDDMAMDYDGDRTFTFNFTRGDLVKSFAFRVPFLLYRGTYSEGKQYEKGDNVTWGGSLYVATQDTTAKPGQDVSESRAWRLAAKEGRDGRTGPMGPQGPMGLKGK